MSLISSLPHAFGLHISDRTLKLVLLRPQPSLWIKTFPVIDVAVAHTLPEGVIVNGEIKKRDLLIQEFHALFNNAKIKKISTSVGIVANLPEAKTFMKFVTLSGKTGEEVSKYILKSVTSEIPIPQEELTLNTQIFKDKSGINSALIGAASKTTVDAFTSVLEELNLNIFALEVESVAIARAILPATEEGELKKTEMIIDIGSERTSAIFTTGGIPRLTMLLPFSGNLLSKAIAEKLNLPLEKAEEIKLRCGLDIKKCEGALKESVSVIIDDFISKVRDAIKFYHSQFIDAPKIGQIHLSGGGAYLQKLDSILSKELRIKARPADLYKNIVLPPKGDGSSLLHFVAAIGLSLRGSLAPFPEYE